MSNANGCCCCLPSWVATIPGWLFAVAGIVVTLMLQFYPIVFAAATLVYLIPFVLSVTMEHPFWPRVVLMIFYVLVSTYMTWVAYFIPAITRSEECHAYPDRCDEIERDAILIAMSWAVPNFFVWVGLVNYIRDSPEQNELEIVYRRSNSIKF